MKELEKKLRVILKITERSHQKLRKINEQLRSFYTRLEDISVQHKRRLPITDISFEANFRKTIEDLGALSDKNYSFWQEVRNEYHNKYKKLIKEDQRFLIKQISISALSFTRQTDELFTVYKNLQNLGKDLPLRLNWWLFENSTQNLLNTTNRILFLVRSMEKFYA